MPESGSRRLTHMEAVIEAIAQEMRADARIFMIGQDIGAFQGAMQSARGLFAEFGPDRIMETPISESAMVGTAIGAALFGMRPIVDISFGEFLPAAMNQLINQAPNIHYMTGGKARVPVVIRTRVGNGPYGGHPQDYSAWFAHVPGLKVVMPATPADAKGLMVSAIRDDNPVLFIEPMSLSHAAREVVSSALYTVPIGTARLAQPGDQVTVVAIGSMVPVALRAAQTLALDGIRIEVVDLRSLRPWDDEMVLTSVRKTGGLVIAHEGWITAGFGSEVVATVAEQALDALVAPVGRVGAAAVPIPSGPLRRYALPNEDAVVEKVRQAVRASGR
ncbi:MAG: pyruvate dehydrogenase complex E1 component subunit beta [Candidatus Dormiibacterota bacterium]